MQKLQSLKMFFIFSGILCITTLLLPQSSSGETYPSKTITMIVPHGVGGGGDVAARILGAGMQKDLGVNFVVKNITGGGSITGLSALWRSKPDGYTICMSYAQMACTTHIFEKVIYDPKKFVSIARFVRAVYMLAVPKNSSFRSVMDFKKSEKPIRVGVSHVTSNSAMTLSALGEELGFKVTFVSGYPGAAASILGAFKGENDVVTYGSALTPYIKTGELIPLLVYEMERSKEFPDVPCLKDLGLPEYLSVLGGLDYMIWGPPGMPNDKVKVMEEAVLKATNANIEKFENMGALPSPLPSEKSRQVLLTVYDYFKKYGTLNLNPPPNIECGRFLVWRRFF